MRMRPTIVLVHGAFAESASWNSVIDALLRGDYPVVAAANPLRGVAEDAGMLSDHVRTIDGPVVLVAHSYGGAVISNVDPDAGDIRALVYVAAFAPAPGESCLQLTSRFPGSTLDANVEAIPRADGSVELAIARDRFHAQFAADVSAAEAALMAATQRPVAQTALEEPAGDRPLWEKIPSSFVFGDSDLSIPPAALRWMAERADARQTVELAGASHALSVSRPSETAEVLLQPRPVLPRQIRSCPESTRRPPETSTSTHAARTHALPRRLRPSALTLVPSGKRSVMRRSNSPGVATKGSRSSRRWHEPLGPGRLRSGPPPLDARDSRWELQSYRGGP
jgi:pimeloyl-ACP methyl ester carboxylesterase